MVRQVKKKKRQKANRGEYSRVSQQRSALGRQVVRAGLGETADENIQKGLAVGEGTIRDEESAPIVMIFELYERGTMSGTHPKHTCPISEQLANQAFQRAGFNCAVRRQTVIGIRVHARRV